MGKKKNNICGLCDVLQAAHQSGVFSLGIDQGDSQRFTWLLEGHSSGDTPAWLAQKSFQNSVSMVSALQPLFVRAALTHTRRVAEAERSVERAANLKHHCVKQRERWQCGEPFRLSSFRNCLPVFSLSQAFCLANELCHLSDTPIPTQQQDLESKQESAGLHACSLCSSATKTSEFSYNMMGFPTP